MTRQGRRDTHKKKEEVRTDLLATHHQILHLAYRSLRGSYGVYYLIGSLSANMNNLLELSNEPNSFTKKREMDQYSYMGYLDQRHWHSTRPAQTTERHLCVLCNHIKLKHVENVLPSGTRNVRLYVNNLLKYLCQILLLCALLSFYLLQINENI